MWACLRRVGSARAGMRVVWEGGYVGGVVIESRSSLVRIRGGFGVLTGRPPPFSSRPSVSLAVPQVMNKDTLYERSLLVEPRKPTPAAARNRSSS